MVKEEFLVVGKQKITSQSKGVFNMVHLVVKFSDREAATASGRKSVTTMVSPEEFDEIKIGKYRGFVVQNGRYTNVSFDEFLEAQP